MAHRPSPSWASLPAAACALALAAVSLVWLVGVRDPADSAAPAGPFHVSPQGHDTADGTTQHPWRTIAHATATAPAQARIMVATGTYGPFAVTKAGQRVIAPEGQQVVVRGASGVRDVVRVSASSVTVSGLTVTHCVPDPDPAGRLEDVGSSDVRIDDGTSGVVLHRLTITDSRGTNDEGLPFGCYGVFAHDAEMFRVVDSDISGTGLGVYVNGGGRQSVIAANTIHDNDVIIRDTHGGNDDFGGNGVNLADVSQDPGVVVTRNTVTHNYGPSADYGVDGGAFEIYNASYSRFTDNRVADNDDVLETGSSPGGGCLHNVFSGNHASGRTAGSGLDSSPGLLLRCATDMVVHDNTLTNLDWWTFDIQINDEFSTDVDGLSMSDNTVTSIAPAYQLGVNPATSGLVATGNVFSENGSTFARYTTGGADSPTLSNWQRRTGLDRTSSER